MPPPAWKPRLMIQTNGFFFVLSQVWFLLILLLIVNFLSFYILEHILALTSCDIIIQYMVSFALYIVLHALDLLCLQLDAFLPLNANCSVGFLPIIRYWDTRQSNPVHTQQLPDRCYSFTVWHPLMVCWHCRSQFDSFQLAEPSGNILIQ